MLMARRRIALHEIAYERLGEAERRSAHPPSMMLSGSSKGPMKMWVCGEARCGEVTHTRADETRTPVCFGGMKWSFVTAGGIFDPRVHHPWASVAGEES
jgi:hypothetical protein